MLWSSVNVSVSEEDVFLSLLQLVFLTRNVACQGDEHFTVWMRTAALRNFRKLLGRIDADIPAGANITIDIQNRCSAAVLLIGDAV